MTPLGHRTGKRNCVSFNKKYQDLLITVGKKYHVPLERWSVAEGQREYDVYEEQDHPNKLHEGSEAPANKVQFTPLFQPEEKKTQAVYRFNRRTRKKGFMNGRSPTSDDSIQSTQIDERPDDNNNPVSS